jgi:outer membrane protein assembly factor BamB
MSLPSVSVVWGQQPAGTCNNNWSEFHRPNMVRSNQCEKVLNVNNVGNLTLKWRSPTDDVYSPPAVVDGVVYVGSADSNVYALNAKTGAKLWSYTTGGRVFSSPAVANGAVYVGLHDNNVYSLNAKTGTKLWSYGSGPGLSSPAVVNGAVYFGSGYPDDTVYALNAKTDASCGALLPASRYLLRPRSRMGRCMSAQGTPTCTR